MVIYRENEVTCNDQPVGANLVFALTHAEFSSAGAPNLAMAIYRENSGQ